MAAIVDCAKAIKNLGNGNKYEEMNQLIQIIERAIHQKTSITEKPTTTTFEPVRLRVPLNIKINNTCHMISMTQPTRQLPKIATPAVLRVKQSTTAKHKHRKKRHKPTMNITAPAHNTRY